MSLLYQKLFHLMAIFLGDAAKYRRALLLIVAHQRLRSAYIPLKKDLSAGHCQIRATTDQVLVLRSDPRRRRKFDQLLEEMRVYRNKLEVYQVAPDIIASIEHLTDIFRRYRHALSS